MVNKKGVGAFGIFIMLFALAVVGQGKIAIHPDCVDEVDNNGDGLTDFEDMNCQIYPYRDGNGENPTPLEQMNKNDAGYAYGNEWNALKALNPNSIWVIDVCNAPYIPYDQTFQNEAWVAQASDRLPCQLP